MADDKGDAAFNREQAARARRLAKDIQHSHPDIARQLEALATEFETRADSKKDRGP
jgi:N-acetyl-anhydromuramyl-L-alanine amidase AmpD